MRKWLFWKANSVPEQANSVPEQVIMEVDPDDEEITDAHITFSEENERLVSIIAVLEQENEELKLENEQLRNIIKMGESKA